MSNQQSGQSSSKDVSDCASQFEKLTISSNSRQEYEHGNTPPSGRRNGPVLMRISSSTARPRRASTGSFILRTIPEFVASMPTLKEKKRASLPLPLPSPTQEDSSRPMASNGRRRLSGWLGKSSGSNIALAASSFFGLRPSEGSSRDATVNSTGNTQAEPSRQIQAEPPQIKSDIPDASLGLTNSYMEDFLHPPEYSLED